MCLSVCELFWKLSSAPEELLGRKGRGFFHMTPEESVNTGKGELGKSLIRALHFLTNSADCPVWAAQGSDELPITGECKQEQEAAHHRAEAQAPFLILRVSASMACWLLS